MRRAGAALGLLLAACEPAAAAQVEHATAIDLSHVSCGECHEREAREWSGSLHARAWDDPIFQREYASTPSESCRDCHAPSTSAPGRATGIDCATCHVRDGHVLATRTSEAGERAHPMRIDAALQTPDHCAGCHQFAFMDDGSHAVDEALQNTLVEFLASDASRDGATCQTCHMRDEGVVSHRFPGVEDPEQLARAVDVEIAARRGGGRITVDVRIEGADIGHAFPTGDVFRRAELSVTTPAGAHEAFSMQRWLGDTIDADGASLHVRTIDDSRVPPPGTGELRETLELVDDGADAIAWELRLHRIPTTVDARTLAGVTTSHLVARGVVAIAGPR
jgi:hypothetical protein